MQFPFSQNKTYSLSTLLLFIAVIALAVIAVQLWSSMVKGVQNNSRHERKIVLLQVQWMDSVFTKEQSRNVGQLLENPNQWLAPLKERINADPEFAQLLKEVGFHTSGANTDSEEIEIYCNPVDGNPEPYEVFTFTFSGNVCVHINRRALCPW